MPTATKSPPKKKPTAKEAAKPSAKPTAATKTEMPKAIIVKSDGAGLSFIVNRKNLLAAADFVGEAIKAKAPKPVLAGMLLVADGRRLRVSGTDLEIWLAAGVPEVQIESKGSTIIIADRFREILRRMRGDTVSIQAGSDKATISDSGATFTLYTYKPDDFPAPPQRSDAVEFEVGRIELQTVLSHVNPFIAKGEVRHAMDGMLMELKSGRLTVVATNGRAMAVDWIDGPKKLEATCILPGAAIPHIRRMEGEEDARITVRISPSHASFECEDATMGTSLVEGRLPSYPDVIPKDCNRKFVASHEELASVISQASTLAENDEGSKGVRLHLKDGLTLTSRKVGEGESTVRAAGKYDGAELEIGGNPQFLADAIAQCGETVAIEFSAANRPIKVSGGGNFIAVIMPINLQ